MIANLQRLVLLEDLGSPFVLRFGTENWELEVGLCLAGQSIGISKFSLSYKSTNLDGNIKILNCESLFSQVHSGLQEELVPAIPKRCLNQLIIHI